MMRESKSTYVFTCDFCGQATQRSEDMNPPSDWVRIEAPLLRNELHACKQHGATVVKVLEMLKIKHESRAGKIRIFGLVPQGEGK